MKFIPVSCKHHLKQEIQHRVSTLQFIFRREVLRNQTTSLCDLRVNVKFLFLNKTMYQAVQGHANANQGRRSGPKSVCVCGGGGGGGAGGRDEWGGIGVFDKE